MSEELVLMAGCGSYCSSCIESKGVDHCGVCDEFPCDDLINHYNPNNPHGQRNAVTRTGVLAYRSKHGDERALELLKNLGRPPSP